MSSLSTTNPASLSAVSPHSRFAVRALAVAAASAFVALCAHIALPLPFSPVPLTLQTFAVLLVGLTLGPALGASALALYLAEGLCGLPVFAPTGLGGLLQLCGPTGGYLLAYPAAAALAGWLSRRLTQWMPPTAAAITAGAFSIELILAGGAAWLAVFTHARIAHVFLMGVVPFLPGEAVKILAAAGIATAWLRLRRRAA